MKKEEREREALDILRNVHGVQIMRKALRLQEIIGKSSVSTKPQETDDRFLVATDKPTLFEHLFNEQAVTPPLQCMADSRMYVVQVG